MALRFLLVPMSQTHVPQMLFVAADIIYEAKLWVISQTLCSPAQYYYFV